MKKITILLAIAFLSTDALLSQQEKHYSMFFASPSLLNPAATATMKEDISFFTNFRMQWLTAVEKPFRSNSFSGELKLFNSHKRNGYLGTGLHFTNDITGEAQLMTNAVSVPINYVFKLGTENLLSVGVLPGFIQQSVIGRQTWDNQWNGVAFDPGISSGEASGSFSAMAFDIGAGVYYQYTSSVSRSSFNVGFSANHLTSPGINYTTVANRLYRRYVAHMGGTIRKERSKFSVSPQAYAFFQGPSMNLVFGSSFDVYLRPASRITDFITEHTLSFGVYHRWQDAIIATVYLKLAQWQFGLAYDANISSHIKATSSVGAFELFLKYSFLYNPSKRYIR